MARLNVSPTRMELGRLKKRLGVARNGHKLLKDKRDELMKQFMSLIRKNKELRLEAEAKLGNAQKDFLIAGAMLSEESLDAALMLPSRSIDADVSFKNITGVTVPEFEYKISFGTGDPICYGFNDTNASLDKAVASMDSMVELLLELAKNEKAARLLSCEIEKTRRRVNALEYVMIPQLEETIKYIRMKMEENERGTKIRLMKVKDMVLEKK
ncbi:MAG: V-type ATP synthase subunit D [Clostridia bacterium]|nr:V-type ATP synthase subunit D [Clostridia bacterium]